MGAAIGNAKGGADSDSAVNGARDGVVLDLTLIFGLFVKLTTRVRLWESQRAWLMEYVP